MTRTAAPVWVPYCWQHELLLEDDVENETTANRRYRPLSPYPEVKPRQEVDQLLSA
jgi:hypothetical protein